MGASDAGSAFAEELYLYAMEQEDACRQLFAAVLHEALKDVAGKGTITRQCVEAHFNITYRDIVDTTDERRNWMRSELREYLQDRALVWFESKSEEAGSFRWICERLDLDAKTILIGVRAVSQRVVH